MNYLALCQRLRQEAAIQGSGPSAVTGQSGEYLRVVDWVADAWNEIQKERTNWKFLWKEDTQAITSGNNDYDISGKGLAELRLDTFMIYVTADGISTRSPITFLPYEEFKDKYDIQTATNAKPSHVTQLPSGELRTYPTTNGSHTITFEAFTVPVALSADGDTPAVHARFHMAIVWRALMFYGEYEEDSEVYARAEGKYMGLLNEMFWELLLEEEDLTVRPQ